MSVFPLGIRKWRRHAPRHQQGVRSVWLRHEAPFAQSLASERPGTALPPLRQGELRLDVHRRELVGEILEDVGQRDHLHIVATLTRAAECLPQLAVSDPAARREHRRREQRAALAADERLGLIGAMQQPLLHDERRAVRQQRVALHLSEPDASVDLAPMHRLVCDLVDRPRRSHLVLVGHHVAEALIVHHAHEDLHLHLDAVHARVHGLGAVVRIPSGAQLLPEVVDRAVLLGEAERRAVLHDGVHGARLARHRLEEHADRHARGEAVRVEQDVGRDARLGERHVLRRPQPRHHALLPVARRELVAGDRVAVVPQLDGGLVARGARRVGGEQPHLLDDRGLRRLVPLDGVAAGALVDDRAQRVALLHLHPHVRQPVRAEARLEEARVARLAFAAVAEAVAEGLPLAAQLVEVDGGRRVDGGVAEPALVRPLVDDHRVLHVVPGVRDDRHHRVGARGVVVHLVLGVRFVADDGRLRRLDAVGLRVSPVREGVVRRAHSLLAHLALIHVARRLVEVTEGRERGDDGEEVGRRDLPVRRLARLQRVLRVSDAQRGLLQRPHLLDRLQLQVHHRPEEARGAAVQKQPGEAPIGARQHQRDLQRRDRRVDRTAASLAPPHLELPQRRRRRRRRPRRHHPPRGRRPVRRRSTSGTSRRCAASRPTRTPSSSTRPSRFLGTPTSS
mmetsp:Transcript_29419/g.73543  ORF Transcript_29419/g.73543 Transcript_29419/m.73543 type:complete len:678 (+) Transcript_29419:260-2293(+)